jgi:hypothetical protein
MANYIDLSGIIGLQRNFINRAGSTGATPEQIAAVNLLDASLNSLSQALNAAGQSIGPTLTYQTEVQRILNREKNRLDAKKSTIDAAYQGQKRMIDLTNSSTKRTQAYNLILIVAVITFLIVLAIKNSYDNEIIPNALLDIMNIIVLAGGSIYCIVLYINAYHRSKMDFDQIVLDDPPQPSQAELEAAIANNKANGQLSDSTSRANAGCIGAQCCPSGSTFNEFNKICVPGKPSTAGANDVAFYDVSGRNISWRLGSTCVDPKMYDPLKLVCAEPAAQGFTTMNTSAGAKPYTPCEFSQYNVYNSCGSSAM